jgi:nitroreductase
MDALECIFSRRSIRKYRSEPVSEEKIEIILKAGMNAPSAGNEQPWHFVVIDDRKLLNQIADFHPYAKMLYEAPQAIVVCGDPSLEKHKHYWPVDCSAATQNMLLAIQALGLGGVWIGVYPREHRMQKLKELLKVPDPVQVFAVIACGYPAEQKPPANRYRPERIHFNTWKQTNQMKT